MIPRLKIRSCLLALGGSAILAFGLYHIHSFAEVTEGGVLGLTLLLQYWLGLSPAVSGLILNAACYLLGWRTLGREFIGYSIIAGGGFSLFYAVFEQFPPIYPQIADYPLIAAVLGAVFVGVGVGLAVRAGGAPGGDDALAMSLSHILKWDIRWIYLLSDLLILGLSATYIPFRKLGYSLLTVILSGQIVGWIQKIGAKNER
ncbi:MAG: YitT family protein [Christensenellaceae bacterium]|nr:YitT family protein [Christensenellaceae bacterium]